MEIMQILLLDTFGKEKRKIPLQLDREININSATIIAENRIAQSVTPAFSTNRI